MSYNGLHFSRLSVGSDFPLLHPERFCKHGLKEGIELPRIGNVCTPNGREKQELEGYHLAGP